jgi:glycosyltransferase involved in cell wall biosynthesis
MKLNWFSPLPPAPTGIATYAALVLAHLGTLSDVTVWTDQPTWTASLERSVQVQRYKDWQQIPWRQVHQADLNIYHIGNDVTFHGGIWQLSRRCPGLVVLHDLELQELFCGIADATPDGWTEYVAGMTRCYGLAGAQAARQLYLKEQPTAAIAHSYPLTEWALENAIGALFHNRQACQAATQTPAWKQRWHLGYTPLPWAAKPSLAPRSHRPPYQLILFGYLGANRRIEAILMALAALPERHQFRLHLYGQIADPQAIEAAINRLSLKALVQIHGFVSDEILDQALATTDLAFNLRSPTVGEASLSQLQIWQHALPSLVSQAGWYAQLPAGTVAWVRPGHEIADIQTHLQQFLADPARYAAIGHRGQAELRAHHAPQDYAEALVEFARICRGSTDSWASGFSTVTAQQMSDRAAVPLASWARSGSANGRDLTALAQAIAALTGDGDEDGDAAL